MNWLLRWWARFRDLPLDPRDEALMIDLAETERILAELKARSDPYEIRHRNYRSRRLQRR